MSTSVPIDHDIYSMGIHRTMSTDSGSTKGRGAGRPYSNVTLLTYAFVTVIMLTGLV